MNSIHGDSLSTPIDPWGYTIIEDYNKLLEDFGIRPIREIVDAFNVRHIYFTRGVIFGHRDLDSWLRKLESRDKVAVLTGFMPSGEPHLGTAMVYEELKYLQGLGAFVKIAIADAEAYIVRRESREETIKRGLSFIAHAIAWGIDPDRAEFYYQTNMSTTYYRLIQMFSRKITEAEMRAIYGDLSPGKIISALTQASDILHIQLDEYGGYRYVLVPVGADQDPHLRLTRDLVDRFENELPFTRPSSMYHKLLRGLDGNKMSKSRPDFAIHLSEPINIVEKKVMNALTGGRATAEEQRRLGGEPHKCTIFELYTYHLIRDDNELRDIYLECVNGKILCGECKRRAFNLLKNLLLDHQARYEEARGKVERYVKPPRF